MTNEPKPNTRAGEALMDSAVELMGEALFKFSGRMKMAGVFAAGSELTDANAASYERVVGAWQKLTGEIERSKLPTWDHYAEEHVDTRPLPQPSEFGTAWQSAVEETDMLERELDLTNVDHVALWLEANAISPPLTHQLGWVACRITEAYEAQIAKLQADGDKLAGALERSRQGWSNVLELGLLPVQHQSTALGLQEAATQALTEWKDRA